MVDMDPWGHSVPHIYHAFHFRVKGCKTCKEKKKAMYTYLQLFCKIFDYTGQNKSNQM